MGLVNLLLDTCTFLWLAANPERISEPARIAIDTPENCLWISDISIWEICMKYSAGKLPLPSPARIWIPDQVAFFHVHRLHLQEQAIYLSGELPAFHRDPFDRLIAAQAQKAEMCVITPDQPFADLGTKTIW
jgi:PIN domain nuclease of toxin-antitoxin system